MPSSLIPASAKGIFSSLRRPLRAIRTVRKRANVLDTGRLPRDLLALIIHFAWTDENFTLGGRTNFFLTSHLVSAAYTLEFTRIFHADVHLLTPGHLHRYFGHVLRGRASIADCHSITAHFRVRDVKETEVYTEESKAFKGYLSRLLLQGQHLRDTHIRVAYHLDGYDETCGSETLVIYQLKSSLSWDDYENSSPTPGRFWSRTKDMLSCTGRKEVPNVKWSQSSTTVIDLGSESVGEATLVALPLKSYDDFQAFDSSFQFLSGSSVQE